MINLFNELCEELEILRYRENTLIKQAEIAQQQCFSSRVDRNTYLPLDVALYNYDDAMERLDSVREAIEERTQLKLRIESMLDNIDEMPARVAYMRDIQRLPLNEIAKRTNYSYSYVKKISMKSKRLKLA